MQTTMEKIEIKRRALEKLDILIQAELDRLSALSSRKAIYKKFELVIPDDYFTKEEKSLLSPNIRRLENIKKKQTQLTDAIKFLKTTISSRGLTDPWATNQNKTGENEC